MGASEATKVEGEKVGRVGRLRNVEYLLVAGEEHDVRRAVRAARGGAA